MIDKKLENFDDERLKKYFHNYFGYILGFQDYSLKELQDKGYKKHSEKTHIVDEVLDFFVEKKYVSDERYAEIYTRSKHNNGYGSIRIKMELKNKGICSSFISEELDKFDFYERSKEVKLNKYGEDVPSDFKVLKKQKDYMLRRGFTMDEVNYAFSKD